MRRRKVLFSDRYGWEKQIRRRINPLRYIPCFTGFQKADLDAFDILIPQHLSDITFLNENRPDMHGKKCFIPPLAAMNACNDKMQFNRFMHEIGYGHLIPKINNELSFPYILKKRIDENGTRSRIITNKKEEKPFQRFIDSDDYFRQEYVTGQDEFTTHILMTSGKIAFHRTVHFRFREDLFVKGIGYHPASKKNILVCPYIDTFTSILNQLKFEGLCCFNYKLVDGQMQIFEVNPRYGGSLTLFLPAMLKAYIARLEEY